MPPTIGVEFASKIVPIRNGQSTVRAQLWDTAGQERYRSMVKQQYQRAHGAFMVYDVTKRGSFSSIQDYWLPQFREVGQEHAIIILVGNQVDRCQMNEDMREVQTNEAQQFAKENDLMFIETSAVLNSNVVDAFQLLIESKYFH